MDEFEVFEEVDIDVDLYEEWDRAKRDFDHAKEALDHASSKIKKQLQGNTIITLSGEPALRFTRYPVQRLDSRRLRKEWPDIWEQFSIETTSERLTRVSAPR